MKLCGIDQRDYGLDTEVVLRCYGAARKRAMKGYYEERLCLYIKSYDKGLSNFK